MNFDRAFEILIGHEGGYVNDPRDPGGETKYGISKRSYPRTDIKNLTLDQAKEIYKRDFWDAMKADYIPDGAIRLDIFDMAVNSGLKTCTKLLQRSLGVNDDGVLGPDTLAALHDLKWTSDELRSKFNANRLLFYTSLSTWKTYGKGWTKRVANNMLIGG